MMAEPPEDVPEGRGRLGARDTPQGVEESRLSEDPRRCDLVLPERSAPHAGKTYRDRHEPDRDGGEERTIRTEPRHAAKRRRRMLTTT